MKIVAISDTHCKLPLLLDQIPDGDLLVHCGDLLSGGTVDELASQYKVFKELNNRFTVGMLYTPGNHDWICQKDRQTAKSILESAGVTYVEHEEVKIEDKRIFMSPYTPSYGWWAFMRDRGPQIRRYWDAIPEGLDLLVTHGPPMGYLDTVQNVMMFADLDGEPQEHISYEHVGCEDLLKAVERTKPKHMAFGHIHGAYGRSEHPQGTKFYNCAMLGENYKPKNMAQVFEI